jgi:hypothetical protein
MEPRRLIYTLPFSRKTDNGSEVTSELHIMVGSRCKLMKHDRKKLAGSIKKAEFNSIKDISRRHKSGRGKTGLRENFHIDVQNMIKEKIEMYGETGHQFFLFHPHRYWHSNFATLVSHQEESLGPSFSGYSDDIDILFAFMKVSREILAHEQGYQQINYGIRHTPVQFHLLVPATDWSPVNIRDGEAVQIPKELGNFVMEGQDESLVQINLPASQAKLVRDIRVPAPFFPWLRYWLGIAERHRVLGR